MRGNDNDLIPAQNVAALRDMGGLDKAIWMLPVDKAAQVLAVLYAQRDQVKQTIYEITGMGDILRGASNPNETATAQQIKSQWGSLRIRRIQADIARYLRDLIRLKAEIISQKFDPETLKAMTLVQLPSEQDKQQQMMQIQASMQNPQAAQQAQAQMQQLQQQITWEQVIEVMRSDLMRSYRIDVETDSTIAASMESDMNGMREVLTGIVQFIQGIGPAVQVGAVPVEAVKEIVMTVTRRARMGSAVEDAFEKMQSPQKAQGADPEQMKQMQQQMQQLQQENQQLKQAQQSEQAKLQAQMQGEQMKIQAGSQVDQLKLQQEAQFAQQQLAFEQWKAELEAQTKIQIAQIQASAKAEAAYVAHENTETE